MIEFVMSNVALVSIYLAGGAMRVLITVPDAARMHECMRRLGRPPVWYQKALGYCMQVVFSLFLWPLSAYLSRGFFKPKSDEEIEQIVRSVLTVHDR